MFLAIFWRLDQSPDLPNQIHLSVAGYPRRQGGLSRDRETRAGCWCLPTTSPRESWRRESLLPWFQQTSMN